MKQKNHLYRYLSIKNNLVSSLFIFCFLLLFNCSDEEHKPDVEKGDSNLPAITLVEGILQAKPTSVFRKEMTNAREDLGTSCILDGTFWDECPIDVDPPGGGPGGGGTADPLTVSPDFDPGAINVEPNPVLPGQEVGIAFIIANHGGLKFPAGSLQPLDGIDSDIEGVHVNIHLLSNEPGNTAPNENNLGFIGVFDPIVISPEDYYISLTMRLPSNLTQGKNYRIAVVVDPENHVPELNNSNNTSIDAQELLITSPPSDLTPVISEPSLSLTTVAIGESFTVGCKVKNNGNSLSNTSIKIKYTAHLVGGDELANPITLGTVTHTIPNGQPMATNGLTPKLSKTVTIGVFGSLVPGQVGLAPGDYIIKATVDPDNQITEGQTGETNNVLSLGPLKVVAAGNKPDLIDPGPVRAYVPNDEVFPFPEGAVSIQMSVKNNGTSDAGTFVINYYLSEDNMFTTSDPFLCALQVGGAAMIPGETRNFTVAGQVPANTPPGLYRVWWFIDADLDVSELNEDNNKIQGQDSVDNRLLVQGADFVGGAASLKNKAVPGKRLIVELDVKNQGKRNSSAASAFIDYYLSADTVLNTSIDQNIGSHLITSSPVSFVFPSIILASETVKQRHLVKIPSTIIPPVLGENYLLYNIDPPSSSEPRGKEKEINESNNVGAIGPFNILGACALIDETTAQHFFTDAVREATIHSFCNKGPFLDKETQLWNSKNAFAEDFRFFRKQNEDLNGKFCSDKFSVFYTRWVNEVIGLVHLLKSACTNIHQIDFQYGDLQGTTKEKVDLLAAKFMSEFAALKQSCNSGGVLQPTTDTRVYCGCPDTNYLSDLPGFDPGTNACISPN